MAKKATRRGSSKRTRITRRATRDSFDGLPPVESKSQTTWVGPSGAIGRPRPNVR